MARFHAAVAADVEVPPFFRRDNADIFALCFRTFAGATRDAKLHLVRRTDAFVAVLQHHAEAEAVTHAITAPGAANAGFRHAQRLGVGLAGFKSGVDQL